MTKTNDTLNSSRDVISDRASSVFFAIRDYSLAYDEFKKATTNDKSIYSEEYISSITKTAYDKLLVSTKNIYSELERHLERIKEAALDMENEYDIAELLQPNIVLINTVGKDLDMTVYTNMITPLIGNRQALLALKSVFKVNEIPTSRIDQYIVSAEREVTEISDLAHLAFLKPTENMSQYLQIANQIRAFAIKLGVEFDHDMSYYIPNYATFSMDAIRTSAGLDLGR